MKIWRYYKFKNLTLLFASILFALVLSRLEVFHNFLLTLGVFGYFGAFVAGVLFVSIFTVSTGTVILLVLAEKLSPLEIGIIAGTGAVVGDYLIFRLVKNNLAKEVQIIYDNIDSNHHLFKLLHTKYFTWTFPVIGALIIASPLPDEIGISLMGISKLKAYQFIMLSFILNAVGIFLVVSASKFVKP